MFSSLRKSLRRKVRPEAAPLLARTTTFADDESEVLDNRKHSYYYRDQYRRNLNGDAGDDDPSSADLSEESEEEHAQEEDEEDFPDNDGEQPPLLPIFSSEHLNALPVYTMTHAFRDMVVERCDTVLTWEQLRSPQVSQFLVKPIQQEIQARFMNAATQYALLANALQFNKEANVHPGNSGTNSTRAMLCELIAIKLLRECTSHQLIDALSYDFDPLQGQPVDAQEHTLARRHTPARPARISCIEVAIRASAKRYLAHPLVVVHLEAIWKGTIVFHSAADSMHRRRPTIAATAYGTNAHNARSVASTSNRIATIYNPAEASLFKLSRLRVPRYRNLLSTISFAILLLLFISVLEDKSLDITPLELVFWAWTAGYMLDEVIGFNEQGFSLYIASFWNMFDVGILILLFIHLCMRLYGVALPDDDESKHHISRLSYDVLAASAVLLFPRLFSVLDHYRYFSQLIIAFRMMAADMMAIFFLIIIFCSGFLVALTFAFSRGSHTDTPKDVAYALLQMLLGFTPAAWDRWAEYNWLGKTVLVLFLFVCHFVVVTILITVMTNSFMAIVRNANEEHQYLFAVNVISNVKSDALFAYVPPINVLQWLLTPLRYVLPFRAYLKINRTIIKITHLPILWTIYLYERLVLRKRYIEVLDQMQKRGRLTRVVTQRFQGLIKQPSKATFRQEAALEEVFKKGTMRTARSQERRKSSNVVNNWMTSMADENAEPPQEQDRKVVDKLERRRYGARRSGASLVRDFSAPGPPQSILSDPNDVTSHVDFMSPPGRLPSGLVVTPSALDIPSQHTDADGDDELMTTEDNATDIAPSAVHRSHLIRSDRGSLRRDYFLSRAAPPAHASAASDTAGQEQLLHVPSQADRPRHNRNVSSATMIYNPPADSVPGGDLVGEPIMESPKRKLQADRPYPASPARSYRPSSGHAANSSKRGLPQSSLRPGLPTKDSAAFRSVPDLSHLVSRSQPRRASPTKPRRSSLEMDLVSDIGDNKAIGGGYVGAIPASFASQMAHANHALRNSQNQMREDEERRRQEDSEMYTRLMMARMNSLEEGFREVVHEVRESMKQVGSGLVSRQRSPAREDSTHLQTEKRATRRFRERQERSTQGSGAASVKSADKTPHHSTSVATSGKTTPRMPQEVDQASTPVEIVADNASSVARHTESREESGGPVQPPEQAFTEAQHDDSAGEGEPGPAETQDGEGAEDKQDGGYGLM